MGKPNPVQCDFNIILLLFLFRVGVGGAVESNIMNKHMHFADCGAKFTHASFCGTCKLLSISKYIIIYVFIVHLFMYD